MFTVLNEGANEGIFMKMRMGEIKGETVRHQSTN